MGAMDKIVTGVVAFLVAIVLISPIANTLGSTTTSGSAMKALTDGGFTSAISLAQLIPLVYVALILGLPAYLIWRKIRGGGDM